MTTDHELDAPLSTEVFAEKVFDAIRAAAVVAGVPIMTTVQGVRVADDIAFVAAGTCARIFGVIADRLGSCLWCAT